MSAQARCAGVGSFTEADSVSKCTRAIVAQCCRARKDQGVFTYSILGDFSRFRDAQGQLGTEKTGSDAPHAQSTKAITDFDQHAGKQGACPALSYADLECDMSGRIGGCTHGAVIPWLNDSVL